GRCRNVRGARRRGTVDVRAVARPAHGPALLPVLMRGSGMAFATPPSAPRPSHGLDRVCDATPVITEAHIHMDVGALAGLERDSVVLTAEERRWGRRRVKTSRGRELVLALPTGSVLLPGDLLYRSAGWYVTIEAAAEPVLTVAPRSRDEALRVAFE